MSKKDKRILRLCAIPPPKDFSWTELVTLMNGAGFREYGILKRYQVDAAKEALRTVGVIGEDENGSA